jgi:hypothetical protein
MLQQPSVTPIADALKVYEQVDAMKCAPEITEDVADRMMKVPASIPEWFPRWVFENLGKRP